MANAPVCRLTALLRNREWSPSSKAMFRTLTAHRKYHQIATGFDQVSQFIRPTVRVNSRHEIVAPSSRNAKPFPGFESRARFLGAKQADAAAVNAVACSLSAVAGATWVYASLVEINYALCGGPWPNCVGDHLAMGGVAKSRGGRELRKKPRRQFDYLAKILTSKNEPPRLCTIADISQNGARLVLDADDELPQRFVLLLSVTGEARRFCRLVWQSGPTVGVEFGSGRS